MNRRAFLHRSGLALLATGLTDGPVVHAARPAPSAAALPRIGPAPDFALTDQDGRKVTSRAWRGKVSVVTFIFTACSQTCPLLTAKLVAIQRELRGNGDVHFVAITVDPLTDTPPTLKRYAQAHSADLSRFSFLTGSMTEIDDVVRRFAVYRRADEKGSVDHTFLTSIVDRKGTLRVQYLGTRFDPKEFLTDLRSVIAESPSS